MLTLHWSTVINRRDVATCSADLPLNRVVGDQDCRSSTIVAFIDSVPLANADSERSNVSRSYSSHPRWACARGCPTHQYSKWLRIRLQKLTRDREPMCRQRIFRLRRARPQRRHVAPSVVSPAVFAGNLSDCPRHCRRKTPSPRFPTRQLMYGRFSYHSSRHQHFTPFDYRPCTLKKARRIYTSPISLSDQVQKIRPAPRPSFFCAAWCAWSEQNEPAKQLLDAAIARIGHQSTTAKHFAQIALNSPIAFSTASSSTNVHISSESQSPPKLCRIVRSSVVP